LGGARERRATPPTPRCEAGRAMSDEELLRELLGPNIPDRMAYRIGEIADIVGVEPHVLRYWETEFRIRPQRSPSGQRMYRRKDLARFLRIKKLLHEEGYTIAGARKALSSEVPAELSPIPAVPAAVTPTVAAKPSDEVIPRPATPPIPSAPVAEELVRHGAAAAATGAPSDAPEPAPRQEGAGAEIAYAKKADVARTAAVEPAAVEKVEPRTASSAPVSGNVASVSSGDLFVTAAPAAPPVREDRASATIRALEAAKAVDEAALRDTLRHIEALRARIAATRSRHGLPGDGTGTGGSGSGG
jgi:DNA-binding transcriptional MerR regulator